MKLKYHSSTHASLSVLRRFRDRQVRLYSPGRALVALYYRYSPALADAIRPHDSVRAVVRAALWPLVWALKMASA